MNNIGIREISKENWEEVFEISVQDHQKSFVPSIAESLAFAYLKPWDEALDPYALYQDNQVIGSFYLSYTPNSENNYWIGGFQIDKKFQGKGLGTQALHRILEFIKVTYTSCKVISLTVEQENEHAIRLYEGAGFKSQDKANMYGEMIYKLVVDK